MSAPNAGRQSPEPELQSNDQSGTLAGNVNKQGGAPEHGNAQEASDDQKAGLSSNPTHPLDKPAEEKTSKK
jgi:hypothetical protein